MWCLVKNLITLDVSCVLILHNCAESDADCVGEKTVLILDLKMRAKDDTPNKKHDHPGI